MNKIFRVLVIFSLVMASALIFLIGYTVSENTKVRKDQAADFDERFMATAVMRTLEASQVEQTLVTVEEIPTRQSSGNFDLYIPLPAPYDSIKWEVRDLKPSEAEDEKEGHYGIPPELLKVEEKLVRFPNLSYPGFSGLTAIVGHVDILGAPFYSLGKLELGDYIYIYTSTETIEYMVTSKKTVIYKEESVFIPTKLGVEELRLTTCIIGSPNERLIIFAERVN